MNLPHYSFIMPCHNQWKFTEQAIVTLHESIGAQHKTKGIELIVINNGSTDETKSGLKRLKERFKQDIQIVPVHLNENMGYLMASQIGFSKCGGQLVTLLNNDLIFPDNWFDGIVRTLETDPSIGAAVPFLSYAAGPAGVGVRFDSLEEIKRFSQTFMAENQTKIVYTDQVIGACVCIKRELLSRIGGNDYWFGMGWFEDADWSLRAGIAGYKIAIVGSSFVYHVGNATIGENTGFVHAALGANGPKFSRKWNVVAGFDSKALIGSTPFSSELHYFPCRKEEYDRPAWVFSRKQKQILLAADWMNGRSEWRNQLRAIQDKFVPNEAWHLTLWIPKTYFDAVAVKVEVEKTLGQVAISMSYLHDDVAPKEILTFLSRYSVFVTVPGDYVNRHLRYVLDQSSLPIAYA